MATNNDLKSVSMCVIIEAENNLVLETFKLSIKRKEKKSTYTKHQALNRIIREWAEDREIIVDISKKIKTPSLEMQKTD